MKILHVLARLAAIFCLLLFIGFTVATWFAHSHEKHCLASAAHADGTIVANITKPLLDAGDNSTVQYPQFAFQTPDGITHTVMSNTGSSPASYSVGQHVDVLYTPGNPDAAQIKSFASSGLLTLVMGIFAGATLIGSLFWFFIDSKVIVPKLRAQTS